MLRTAWLLAVSLGAVTACARPPRPPVVASPTKSTPPAASWREDLGYLAGTWNFEGAMNGEPLRYHEVCGWIAGGFHLQCAVGGPQEGFSLLGYQADAEVYVHYNVGADGNIRALHGRVDGKVWRWTGEHVSPKDGKRKSERVRMELVSRDEFTFTMERSTEGGPWAVVLTGTYRRGPAPPATPG